MNGATLGITVSGVFTADIRVAVKEDDLMLVLSRQLDESIMIGDSIRITIVDIRGDKVRLGIEAPRDVSVHRHEVYAAIKDEKADVKQSETR